MNVYDRYRQTFEQFVSLGNLVTKPYSSTDAELKKSLARTRALLKALGEPDKKLKIVHVTGTSGKGSVSLYMHEILRAAGKNVGTYVSPHTTTYLERFITNDQLISAERLIEHIETVISVYEAHHQKTGETLTFFELSTCLALYAFAAENMEWCVLEVGCGGRYDATNVIAPPEVAIITNVDRDHMEILGNSLAKIAYEKAGIIKKGSTVICGESRPALKQIFMKEANANAAALFFVAKPSERYVSVDAGEHQQHNAAIAFKAAIELGIPEVIIREAFEKEHRLPCRFELVSNRPVIFLDGAHSVAKIKALAANIKEQFSQAHILFGCAANKDAKQMMQALLPVAKSISVTRFTTEFRKTSNLKTLLSFIPPSKRGKAYLSPFKALAELQKSVDKKDIIVITGSLFLTGELRSSWFPEEEIIEQRTSWPTTKERIR